MAQEDNEARLTAKFVEAELAKINGVANSLQNAMENKLLKVETLLSELKRRRTHLNDLRLKYSELRAKFAAQVILQW